MITVWPVVADPEQFVKRLPVVAEHNGLPQPPVGRVRGAQISQVLGLRSAASPRI